MTSQTAPIGIFDSGLGGLTVLRQLQRLLPAESVVYLADTANVPYGDKPLAVVRDLALRLTDELARAGAKLVLMASGTSTVAGLSAARAEYPALPILGTIDAGARAAVGRPGPIGVLATDATARSRAFTEAVQALDPVRAVFEQGCPRFVPLVESGHADTADAADAAHEYLAPLLRAGVQTIILGCTHFPFLLPTLRDALADTSLRPAFVDPAEEAVREAAELLSAARLLAPHGAASTLTFAATGDPASFAHHAALLLGHPLPPVAHLRLDSSPLRLP
ncbi:MAG: glutamate racemase [Armatimonadetes bacterium]|nr:glutamate racemase [Armatimonadota bacterium]